MTRPIHPEDLMDTDSRMWLGGWIALCLGIADDNALLIVMAITMFLALLYYRRRDRIEREQDRSRRYTRRNP